MPDDALVRVLGEIQRRGGIGPTGLDDAIAHAQAFADLIPASARVVVDLGSGGGLPALVVAVRRPELVIHLVERRATRADLLRYGVRALVLGERVTVHDDDVHDLASAGAIRADAVTARSFAPLADTLSAARPFLAGHGVALVSAPPGGIGGAQAGWRLEECSRGVAVFHVEHPSTSE